MRRLLAIAVMALTAAGCGSAGETGTTEGVPDPTPEVVAAPSDPASPGSGAPSALAGVTVAAESAIPPISLPEASGDPELDALGAELAGLEQQLLALDAATPDLGGTP